MATYQQDDDHDRITHIADHTAQANESRTGRRWLISIGIGVGITVSGILGQYLPAIVRALQSGPSLLLFVRGRA